MIPSFLTSLSKLSQTETFSCLEGGGDPFFYFNFESWCNVWFGSLNRYTVTVNCPMNLAYYPFDHQVCLLDIESYGGTMTDIRYTWAKNMSSVGISPDVSTPTHSILAHRLKDSSVSLTTGRSSLLYWTFLGIFPIFLTKSYIIWRKLFKSGGWARHWKILREIRFAFLSPNVSLCTSLTSVVVGYGWKNGCPPQLSQCKLNLISDTFSGVVKAEATGNFARFVYLSVLDLFHQLIHGWEELGCRRHFSPHHDRHVLYHFCYSRDALSPMYTFHLPNYLKIMTIFRILNSKF